MLEQLKKVLKSLKWTEGQASVYCTLVEKGAMKPADLGIHAGVAQGKIYSVLDELSKSKGAVIKLESKPTKYDAQNPRYVLDMLISNVQTQKDEALQQGAEEVYEKRYDQRIRETTCWAVQGISGVQVQLISLAADCSSSLKISDPNLNWTGSPEYSMFNKLLREGKTLQVLGTPAFEDALVDLISLGACVRIDKRISSSYYLIDEKAALLKFSMPDCGVVIKDREFVRSKVEQFNSDFERGSHIEMGRIED